MADDRFCFPIASSSSSSSSTSPPSFQSHTLILPLITHASIPQLTIDLLLHCPSLSLTKVAHLDASSDLIPFVGANDSTVNPGVGITTPLEIFSNADLNLSVIQQRSPIFKHRRGHFLNRLVRWIKEAGFKQVLVLGSLDEGGFINGGQEEDELGMRIYQWVPSSTSSPSTATTSDAPKSIDQSELFHRLTTSFQPATQLRTAYPTQPRHPSAAPATSTASKSSTSPNETEPDHLPSLSRPLIRSLTTSTGTRTSTPAALLVATVSEGDNRPDAHRLANLILDFILPDAPPQTQQQPEGKGERHQLAEPPSWKTLFGGPFDQAIFG